MLISHNGREHLFVERAAWLTRQEGGSAMSRQANQCVVYSAVLTQTKG